MVKRSRGASTSRRTMEDPMIRAQALAAAAAAFVLLSAPAQAIPYLFSAHMSGLNENPTNASPATGFTKVILNQAANSLQVDVNWAGLIGGNPAAAHIH